MNMFHVEHFGRPNPLFLFTAEILNERFVLVGVKEAIVAC
jgi:hypothetical protein